VRLTRRGRVVVTGAAALLIAALSMAVAGTVQPAQAGSHAGPGTPPGGAAVTRLVVRPGQTLWTIAQSSDPGADARAVVQQIMQMNSLAGQTILPGEILWVPKG